MVMASVSRAHISDDWRLGWARDGYVVLKDAVSPETAAQATQALFRKDGSDQYQLFPDDEVSKAAILNHKVLELLRTVWRSEPLAIAARRFVYGSEFSPHYDTRLLRVSNPSRFARAWYALEDIHMEAGPLYVLPGSHRNHIGSAACTSLLDLNPCGKCSSILLRAARAKKDWKDVFRAVLRRNIQATCRQRSAGSAIEAPDIVAESGRRCCLPPISVAWGAIAAESGTDPAFAGGIVSPLAMPLIGICVLKSRRLQRNEAPTRVMDFQVRKCGVGVVCSQFPRPDRARYWAPRSQARVVTDPPGLGSAPADNAAGTTLFQCACTRLQKAHPYVMYRSSLGNRFSVNYSIRPAAMPSSRHTAYCSGGIG